MAATCQHPSCERQHLRSKFPSSRNVTDKGDLNEAVERFIKLNANESIPHQERERAFDDILRLIDGHELHVQHLQLDSLKVNSDNPDRPSGLLNLPLELHVQIVSHLDWRSTLSLRLVSHYCHGIVTPHHVSFETSLLTHKRRCQELDHNLELRLRQLFSGFDSPWAPRDFLGHVPPCWSWAFKYPCYTCLRWLHGYNFCPVNSTAGKKIVFSSSAYYPRRPMFLPDRLPYIRWLPSSLEHRRPGVWLSCCMDLTAINYDPVKTRPKTRRCIHCAVRQGFFATGRQLEAAGEYCPPWIVCICKQVFWRYDPASRASASTFGLIKYRSTTLTENSPWRSFWWCEDCNTAGLSKENWLIWAHELRIGETEAHFNRLERVKESRKKRRKIADGEADGTPTEQWCPVEKKVVYCQCTKWPTKQYCPIVKEMRYCRCARWFTREVWDGLKWPGIDSRWVSYSVTEEENEQCVGSNTSAAEQPLRSG